jgi:ATP-binding cassette subfamily C protein
MLASRPSVHPDLAEALRECRRTFGSVALFSGVVNLLMLAGPLYVQIYDRVLSSRSVPADCALGLPVSATPSRGCST